ncbi:MAG: histidine kinase, partial [Lachnospiraceae bacterium]|nr:histidine kinase [Lachnospiraceae bacterium]
MKKLKERYNNARFRTKLLLIFGVTSLLPLLIILIISSRLNTRNMTAKVDELMLMNLKQIAERVNLNLEVYTNVLYQIYQDEEITENIKVLLEDSDTGYAAAYNRINDRLKQYNTTESGVRCTSVICADGTSVVYDFGTGSSIDHLWKNYKDLRMTEPYQEAEGQPGMVITSTMAFKEREGSRQEWFRHYFHIAKRVFDLENLEAGSIATIVMSVDVEALNRICNAGETETGINFIMDPDGRCISYPDEDFSGLKKKDSLSIEEFVNLSGFMENRDISVTSYEDPVTGWIFYNAYDREYILRDVARSQRLYIAIGALAILASAAAILGLVRQINRSVDEVMCGIRRVQGGDMDTQVRVVCRDEIGRIAENFNQMTVQVKNLIKEVKSATDRQKNAEIRALEAQINPHFLYNTLDSINWMAIEKEEYEISRMIR